MDPTLATKISNWAQAETPIIFANCYNYSIIIGKCKRLDGHFVYSGILKGRNIVFNRKIAFLFPHWPKFEDRNLRMSRNSTIIFRLKCQQ